MHKGMLTYPQTYKINVRLNYTVHCGAVRASTTYDNLIKNRRISFMKKILGAALALSLIGSAAFAEITVSGRGYVDFHSFAPPPFV